VKSLWLIFTLVMPMAAGFAAEQPPIDPNQRTSAFTTIGTAALDPAQQATEYETAAAQATIKKNGWILKLPHVKSMGTMNAVDGSTIITVTVDSEKHLDEVENEVPSKLDGFSVMVILYDNHPIFF
jgi:hypothetical protein